jgi:hypothetical protein
MEKRLDKGVMHSVRDAVSKEMKTCFAWAALIGALWCPLALAAKPAPPPPPPPPPSSGDACVGKGGVFPAMAYSRDTWAKKGNAIQYVKTQVFVANSLGTCEVMVYDASVYGSAITASFRFDIDSSVGTLVWFQGHDNGETDRTGRPVIKVAQFHVTAGGAISGLPLTAATIFRAASTPFGFNDVELSSDGLRLAFSAEDTVTGLRRLRIWVCDMPSCSGLESAFEASNVNNPDFIGGTFELALGRNELDGSERAYFTFRRSPPVLAGDLVMIERHPGGWTSPVVLVANEDFTGDASSTSLRQPSVLSVPGLADRVALTSQDGAGSTNPLRVDIFDVGAHSLARSVGFGFAPSWTNNPSTDPSPPNILVGNSYPSPTGRIREIDLDGQPEVDLPILSGVFGVHSAQ